MKDDMREKLSAYLDGALTEAERRDVESRLAASSDLRGELESLRAVSQAVKDLPKSPLPAGYIARLQARRARARARDGAERREWVLLPPAYRPVAFALSSALVAIVLWDRFSRTQAPFQMPYASVKVIPQSEAPVSQIDFSNRITVGKDVSATPEAVKNDSRAKASLESLGFAARRDAPTPRRAPGQPMEFAEDTSMAAGAPAASTPASLLAKTKAGVQMSEEERSRRNEEFIMGLEKEKRSMGIAQVLPRRASAAAARGASAGGSFGGSDMMMLQASPEPEPQALASNTPSLVSRAGRAASKRLGFGGSPAPELDKAELSASGERLDYAAGIPSDDAGLVFTDGNSLASSWVLLGLPGNYPAVDYWSRRAVLLKRSSTKILEIRAGEESVQVYFRLLSPGEASDPTKDRFATIPLEPKPVSLLLLPR